MVPTKSASLFEFVRKTDSEILSPDCIYFQIFPPNCFHLIVDWCVWLQLFLPQKVVIPERYMPDSDEESITEEEKAARREKADKIKRILTQQRYATLHSRSAGMGWACIATG